MSRLSVLGGGEACGARWTLGALLLAPLAAANSSYCAVLAIMLLAAYITLASKSTYTLAYKFQKSKKHYVIQTIVTSIGK